MKSKVWALLLGAVLLMSAGLGVFLMQPGEKAVMAQIYLDGDLVKTVDLRIDQQTTIDGAWGSNTVTVKDGKIAVTDVTCPDHHCMNRGFCDGGPAIVCLPNKLVIKFVGQQDVDAAVG